MTPEPQQAGIAALAPQLSSLPAAQLGRQLLPQVTANFGLTPPAPAQAGLPPQASPTAVSALTDAQRQAMQSALDRISSGGIGNFRGRGSKGESQTSTSQVPRSLFPSQILPTAPGTGATVATPTMNSMLPQSFMSSFLQYPPAGVR